MSLPTSKTQVSADLDRAFWLFFGPPGVGKSTVCSEFPDPIFATTEQAHRHLQIFNRPIKSWPDFKAFVLEMQTKDGQRFRSICIDTIDNLYKLCLENTCEEAGIDHPSDQAFGKGYDLVNTAMQREIVKLTLLGKGIFFVSHAKQVEVTSRNMKYSKTVPSMQGGCHKIILPLVDFEAYVGFSSIDVNQRAAIFEPREALEAKDRFGKMPKEVILPKGRSYEALKKAWSGDKSVAAPANTASVPTAVRRVVRKT